jgi:hypothetical protein
MAKIAEISKALKEVGASKRGDGLFTAIDIKRPQYTQTSSTFYEVNTCRISYDGCNFAICTWLRLLSIDVRETQVGVEGQKVK